MKMIIQIFRVPCLTMWILVKIHQIVSQELWAFIIEGQKGRGTDTDKQTGRLLYFPKPSVFGGIKTASIKTFLQMQITDNATHTFTCCSKAFSRSDAMESSCFWRATLLAFTCLTSSPCVVNWNRNVTNG